MLAGTRSDSLAYFEAAKNVRAGLNLYAVSPGGSPYVYPPHLALMLVPFTSLKSLHFDAIWLLIQGAGFVGLGMSIKRLVEIAWNCSAEIASVFSVGLLLLFREPISFDFQCGNVSTLLACSMAMALASSSVRSAWLTVGLITKPQIASFIFCLKPAREHWIKILVISLAGFALPFLFVGGFSPYIAALREFSMHPTVVSPLFGGINVSLAGIPFRFLHLAERESVQLCQGFAVIGLLMTLVPSYRKRITASFGMLILFFSLQLSPVVWVHHYVLFLPVLVAWLCAFNSPGEVPKVALIFVPLLLLVNTQWYVLQESGFPGVNLVPFIQSFSGLIYLAIGIVMAKTSSQRPADHRSA